MSFGADEDVSGADAVEEPLPSSVALGKRSASFDNGVVV